jgi:two-component system, cell cycle sensor histidine kinase and response regulator CckA
MRFLILDDSTADRQLILRLVQQVFPEVDALELQGPQDFEQAIKRGMIDLVLTDYRLSWSADLEFVREIRTWHPQVPIIIVTGTGSEEVAVRAMKAGATDYVSKTQLNDLPQAIERALANARLSHQQAEDIEQLRRSEERYRTVSELTSDYSFACRVEIDGRVQVEWVTEAFKQILGHTPEQLDAEQAWQKLVHADDLSIARRSILRILSGQPETVEFRLILESGEVRWMRHFVRPMWDEEQKRVVRIYGAAQDITARQRFEERLRQTTSELQGIFNALPDLYFRLDADGTILDYHAAKPSDLYVPPEAFLGKRLHAVLPTDVSLALFQAVLKVRKTGLLTRLEYELTLRNGLRRFEARLLPLREKQIIAIIRDITDPKRAEQALLRRERQLETLARSSQQINMVLEVQVVLRTLVSSAMALVDATAGMVGLLIDGEMIFSEFNRQGTWSPAAYRFDRGQGVAGRIIQTRMAYYSNQAAHDSVVPSQLQQELGVDNLACVPILNRTGELLGCIEVHNTVGRRPFDAHDVAMLQGLTASAAIALENAWMLVARQRTEEALRQTEAKYRSIFENALEGIYQITPEGRFFTVNPALVRMLGYESAPAMLDDLDGSRHQLYVHPGRRQEFIRLLQLQEHLAHFESQVFRKDGRMIWISESARAVRNAQGDLLHYEGTVADITEHRQAADTLRRSEERFRRLFESAPVGIIIGRSLAAHAILFANPVSAQIFGFNNVDELKNVAFPELIAPSHRGRAEQLMHVVAGGQTPPAIGPFQGLRQDASVFPFYLDLVPIQLSDGTAWVAFATDLTDRSNLEAQLQQAQKLEFIGQLASGVAHDYNNILTIIHGHIDLLLSEPSLRPEMAESLHQMAVAAQRAARLTGQLLAFSQQQHLRLTRLDLNDVAGRMTGILQRLLGEKYSLDQQFQAALPEIVADTGMIEQVLINLLVNARDAMPQGGKIILRTQAHAFSIVPAAAPTGTQPGTFVSLQVVDNGCGMDEATQQRLFEPFFTTKGCDQGTGLGLATVYGIAKQHKGWIEVRSQLEHGSTFELFLPVNGEPESLCAPSLATPNSPSGETILVVEDEDQVRVIMRDLLRRHGYRVIEAVSGFDALRVWTTSRDLIDLLLTDVVLPEGLSGRELARQLRLQKPQLKIVFTSGYKDEQETQQSHADDDCQFLIKPFQGPALVQVVRRSLDQPGTTPQPHPR